MNTIPILVVHIPLIRIIPALIGPIIQHLVMLRHTGRNSLPKQILWIMPSKGSMGKQVRQMQPIPFPGGLIQSFVLNIVICKTTFQAPCIDGGTGLVGHPPVDIVRQQLPLTQPCCAQPASLHVYFRLITIKPEVTEKVDSLITRMNTTHPP